MKAKKIITKLTLNKKTIANLENKEMNTIRGGCARTFAQSGCYTTSIPYCCWQVTDNNYTKKEQDVFLACPVFLSNPLESG